eukprot:6211165-Pleurochrysis_carterae.AAC.5
MARPWALQRTRARQQAPAPRVARAGACFACRRRCRARFGALAVSRRRGGASDAGRRPARELAPESWNHM